MERADCTFNSYVKGDRSYQKLLTRSFKERLVEHLGHSLSTPRVGDERTVTET